MKTQIIKIIPCVVAGFILSACVGAVNLPAGTIAETNAQNTDKTLAPKSIIIDDKEPEPIVSEPAHPCIATPFRDTCGGEEFNNAREAICLTERESHRCRAIISVVCPANIFDLLCTEHEPSFPAQKIVCTDELDSNRCAPIIARICETDSLDSLCDGNPTYYSAQETACEEIGLDWVRGGGKCGSTIERVCRVDIFDSVCDSIGTESQIYSASLCSGGYYYRSVYPYLCNHFNGLLYARQKACANEPNSKRCATITARVCGANVRDPYCSGIESYYPAQKTACADEPTSARCAPIIANLITWVCDADSLDALCVDNENYFTAQKMACISELNSERCGRTNARLCGETPFSMACQSRNLTRHDLSVLPNTYFRQSDSNFLSSDCDAYRCWTNYPSIINIKPLNNANTGMATYKGSVSITVISSSRYIDIIVNFDDNTLTYSGNLRGHYIDSSGIPFGINGNFTDRGQITGSVEVRGIEGDLIGLIGQNKAIGMFSSGHGGGRDSFAGGFTATRE